MFHASRIRNSLALPTPALAVAVGLPQPAATVARRACERSGTDWTPLGDRVAPLEDTAHRSGRRVVRRVCETCSGTSRGFPESMQGVGARVPGALAGLVRRNRAGRDLRQVDGELDERGAETALLFGIRGRVLEQVKGLRLVHGNRAAGRCQVRSAQR